MSEMQDGTVRVYVGTRKGGYVVESSRARRRWSVRGPVHAGHEVFHMAPDPRAPGRVFAAVNSPFWGPMIFRSTDGGTRWKELAPPMMPVQSKRTPSYDGSGPKPPIVNAWHLEPGLADDPRGLYLGVDPASLYRSDDLGQSWTPVTGLNDHPTRPKWNPGAGGMCLHTILLDPETPKRMYVGISAAGTFRTDDGGDTWKPTNRGVRVSFLPEKLPEVGQCVHHCALDPSDPATAYRQDHDGIYVSHDRMDSWQRIGRPLPSDFGFVVATAPALPRTAFFMPLQGRTRTTPGSTFQVYRWDDAGRRWSRTVPAPSWKGDFGVHREGMAADGLDPAGIYVGTTTGQLFASPDGGRHWSLVPYQFPAIHSVSVATPPARR
jgi:hypothetical protein